MSHHESTYVEVQEDGALLRQDASNNDQGNEGKSAGNKEHPDESPQKGDSYPKSSLQSTATCTSTPGPTVGTPEPIPQLPTERVGIISVVRF